MARAILRHMAETFGGGFDSVSKDDYLSSPDIRVDSAVRRALREDEQARKGQPLAPVSDPLDKRILAELTARFPWLTRDDDVSGADQVDALNEWFEELGGKKSDIADEEEGG